MTADQRTEEFKAIYKLGVDHATAGRETEAEFEFGRAAAFAPDLWCDVATRMAAQGEEDMALEHFKTALQLPVPNGIRSGIFTNIGNIYARRGQLDAALEMIDLALKENPQSADAYCNRGQIRKWQGNLEQSDRYCERALAINPWHSEAQFLQALNQLDRGNYKRGFELYECRWRSTTSGHRKVECFQPEWPGPGAIDWRTGKPFRHIFVYGEQGAGDIFLMLRYAVKLRELGLKQSWALKPGMAELVATVVDEPLEMGGVPNFFDCQIASASLPYAFRTTMATIPPGPYLGEHVTVWNFQRGVQPQIHIGIAWRGNTGQTNDNVRSSNLEQWQPVLEVCHKNGITIHSLQVDGESEALLYPQIISHPPPANWFETAQRLRGLDLLISVDTGIVHLAGAMGLPVWCALHCRPYFVYPLNCAGTPWYPSVRLFKQKIAFEWQPVFEAIANALDAKFQSP